MNIATINAQPEIRTSRFTLRPLRMSDTGLISLYAGDLRVATGTRSIPHPYPPGAAAQLVTRANGVKRDEDFWALDASEQGGAEFMGLISLDRMDRGQSEVRYWIAPAFWNTGMASEAVRAIINANPHGATRIFAEAFQDNPGAARVLTNCGFEYLGDAEAWSVARGGAVPTWTYTLKTGL
ncbi:GNAT family N-acetyltransferase [Ketogulonicigenium vulgare]|uniref:Acetyltransferase, GNAT family protein n=1 Tax=Ketogulonicigenium vulgare (strain WSH-001) TaxID=759362 RepID=F9Y969_KETVW|nr:GNAT family N-acetyltransferase [Ketogulonicigenium vulgare]ADO41590.1 putative acetyltransferase [Ketogulonicigenium vulgare Y25]AEM41286.1 Acetyltransferase, GNAT family protein [Ketogulonicigenium vulgare WSH-001]ALJ81422.1 acetyltransferase [Ketogulonicigenium vulgare]ANW34143.1 acetyltransferase [Ketogulonicigenium vulgare]AOZ55019.1 acetyltransferase [Ketogulonicigenium vulgare]